MRAPFTDKNTRNNCMIYHQMCISLITMVFFFLKITLLLLIPRTQLNAHVSAHTHNQQQPVTATSDRLIHLYYRSNSLHRLGMWIHTLSVISPCPSIFSSLFSRFCPFSLSLGLSSSPWSMWSTSFTWLQADSTFIRKTYFILVYGWKSQARLVWIYWKRPWNRHTDPSV